MRLTNCRKVHVAYHESNAGENKFRPNEVIILYNQEVLPELEEASPALVASLPVFEKSSI